MTAKGDFFPRRINDHVPDMQYAADVRFGGLGTILIPAPTARNAAGILNDQSIAAAGSTVTFVSADAGAKFGRTVEVVASGAATSDVTIKGKDYLGQPMTETLTLNGAVTVNGNKAFRWIDEVSWEATAATTIDVGWGFGLGLPYRLIEGIAEAVDKVAPTAGVFVAGAANSVVQTATTLDPRGTYYPEGANNPDGVKNFEVTALWDTSNLHGNAHFYA